MVTDAILPVTRLADSMKSSDLGTPASPPPDPPQPPPDLGTPASPPSSAFQKDPKDELGLENES